VKAGLAGGDAPRRRRPEPAKTAPSSSTRWGWAHVLHHNQKFLHNTQMPTASIIGWPPGYTGQETLDRGACPPRARARRARPLTHWPARLASASRHPAERLAGPPSSAETRRRLGERRRTCSSSASGHDEAAALEPARRHCGRRPLRRATGSATPPFTDSWYGLHAPPARGGRLPAGVTALPELYPPTGTLIANPGLLRDGRAARARANSRDSLDPESGRGSTAQVRGLWRRPCAEAELPRRLRARETSRPYRGRLPPARAGARAGARLSGLLRPASSAPAARSCSADVLRPGRQRRRQRAPRGTPMADSDVRSHASLKEMAPELGRVQGTDTAEGGALSRTGPTGKTIVACRDRQPRQRGAAGQAVQEREPRARPRGDGRPPPQPGCLV